MNACMYIHCAAIFDFWASAVHYSESSRQAFLATVDIRHTPVQMRPAKFVVKA